MIWYSTSLMCLGESSLGAAWSESREVMRRRLANRQRRNGFACQWSEENAIPRVTCGVKNMRALLVRPDDRQHVWSYGAEPRPLRGDGRDRKRRSDLFCCRPDFGEPVWCRVGIEADVLHRASGDRRSR